MREINKYILFLVFLTCVACDRKMKQVLLLAGDNRAELELVLSHFKNSPNPLKYRSAKFLIENMPYNYSYAGSAVEYVDSAFKVSSFYPIEQRESVFESIMSSDSSLSSRVSLDLKSIKADYLIQMIDEACDIWHQVNWNSEYDESIFFDYVLPYRLINEPFSSWRSYVKENYPFLYTSTISSNRGINVECEDGEFDEKELKDNEAASGKKMVLLSKPKDSLTLTIHSYGCSSKRLFFKYSTQALETKANIYVNGSLVKTLLLEPTLYETIFRENRVGIDVNLKDGNNQLKVECVSQPFGLDFVRVSSLEIIDVRSLSDYSQRYCSIRNRQSGNYITIDKSDKAKEKQLALKKGSSDNSQKLCLDYLGFPIWKIYVPFNDSKDLCMEVKNAELAAGSQVVQNDYITTY